MVVKNGCELNPQSIQETSTERSYANFIEATSGTRGAVESGRPELGNFTNGVENTRRRKSKSGTPTVVCPDGTQPCFMNVPAYANMNYKVSGAINNDVSGLITDNDRSEFVARRRKSFDSAEGQNSPRDSMRYESEYECMSSPDSFSNSSSNRSSNASSLYGNISPDTLSLASFAGRLNFGRFNTGSKRSSRSSTASSQDSGRQSWGKIRDSFDLSDALLHSARRRSGEQILFENSRPFTPDNFMKFSRVGPVSHMEVINAENIEDLPPPLPTRQNEAPISTPTKKEPEIILPYRVVDLDELQRSLQDIEPYYIHNSPPDKADCVPRNDDDLQPIVKDFENSVDATRTSDFRPVLPPKKRHITHTQSDSCFSSTGFNMKERPIPTPRHSVLTVSDSTAELTDVSLTGESENGKYSFTTFLFCLLVCN